MLADVIKLIKISTACFFLLWLISLTQKDRWPDQKDLSSLILQDPIQTGTQKEPFNKTIRSEEYSITPVADYTLYGIVVSQHRSNSWKDITHEESRDFLNVGDICVMYGANAAQEMFKYLTFRSGNWTCYVNIPGPGDPRVPNGKGFEEHFLSNNHVLTENPNLIKKILETRIGDQIMMKGYLVNYTNVNRWNSWLRSSSLTRDDSGGTACEVMYVSHFEILKKANVFWRFLSNLSWWMMLLLLPAWFAASQYAVIQQLKRNANPETQPPPDPPAPTEQDHNQPRG